MKKFKLLRTLYIIMPMMLCAPVMAADLVGDSIGGRLDWHDRGLNGFNSNIYDSSPTIATVVDPGVEFSDGDTESLNVRADFDSNTITIAYQNYLKAPNQITALDFFFTDLNYGNERIVDVQVISNDFIQMNEASDITFGPDSVEVNIHWQNPRGSNTMELKLLVVTAPPVCDLIDPALVYERLAQLSDPQLICYTDTIEYFEHIAENADGTGGINIGLEDLLDGSGLWYGYVFEFEPGTPGALPAPVYRYDLTLEQVQACRAAFDPPWDCSTPN